MNLNCNAHKINNMPVASDFQESSFVYKKLFEKYVACEEIRSFLDDETKITCQLLRSYQISRPKDIYVPFPWTGDLEDALILFVGFDPLLDLKKVPRLGDSFDLKKLYTYYQSVMHSDQGLFPWMRDMLKCLGLSAKIDLPWEKPLAAYTPVVHCCMNKLKEKPSPVVELPPCWRYLKNKIGLSGANIIVILGEKACVSIMAAMQISGSMNRIMIYEWQPYEKLFVFVPSREKKIDSLLPEEKDVLVNFLKPHQKSVKKQKRKWILQSRKKAMRRKF